jgi:hypothetical protein
MDRHQPSVVSQPHSIIPASAGAEPRIAGRLYKRLATTGGLVAMGLVLAIVLPSSTIGLPACDSAEAKGLLIRMARAALDKAKLPHRTIEIAEIAEVPADARGVNRCKCAVIVNGGEIGRAVYEISWSVRLVVFNRYQVRIVSVAQ